MDYYKIGQRIRKYRKATELTQEQLAEMVGIWVTHMMPHNLTDLIDLDYHQRYLT